jgi:hypothetical protein
MPKKVLWRAKNNINTPFDIGYLWYDNDILIEISRERCGDSYFYQKDEYDIYDFVEITHEGIRI